MPHRPIPPGVGAALRSLLSLPEPAVVDRQRLVINLLIETERVQILHGHAALC